MTTILRHLLLSLFGLLYFLLVHQFNFFISTGIGLFLFIFFELVDGFGKRIPIRELFSFIVFLQLFISPLIAYEYFDNNASFEMYVSQEVYMGYVLPALICFVIGLNLKLASSNLRTSLSNVSFTKADENFAIGLIVVGFISTFLLEKVPGSLRFILYLMMMLKFVGVFIFLFSTNRFRWLWVLLVYGQFTIETIRGAVFYDLFVWIGFLYIFIEVKWQSTFFRKLLFILIGFSVIFFIQSIKREYRDSAWEGVAAQDKEELFLEIAANRIESNNTLQETSDLDRFVSRLNTGWIVSKVMEHTPRYEPFTEGELLQNDIKNVLLPRILFPDKDVTGGKQNQEKFTRFTGRRLTEATTMRIGALSDAYVNFGVIGGWVCMFCLGLFFNLTLVLLFRLASTNIQYLLWIPFIFAYAIRMSDFQVILNYTFKALIFVFVINYLNKSVSITKSELS